MPRLKTKNSPRLSKRSRKTQIKKMNNLEIGQILKHPELGLGIVIEIIQVRVIFYEGTNHGLDKILKLSELTKSDN